MFLPEKNTNAQIHLLLYGNARSQTGAKIHAYRGRGSQTPPKTKQEKVTKIDTKLTSKSDTKGEGTLKRTGKYNVSIFKIYVILTDKNLKQFVFYIRTTFTYVKKKVHPIIMR